MRQHRPDRIGYLPFLDGLRAVAVFLVMGFHGLGAITWRISTVFNGWQGVDVFFVISGFLITTLLVQECEAYGSYSFRDFYVRRTLRIFPAFFVFLLAMVIWYGAPILRAVVV